MQDHNLLSDRSNSLSLNYLRPNGILNWVSAVLLCGIFLVYLGVWISGNRGLLFDPMLQNNDVRTHLIGFHRYTAEKALVDDPIASERLTAIPIGLRFFYRILVPITGLFVASKIVQAMCFFLVILAGFLLMLSKKGSVASGMVLIFFVLHSPNIVIDISGGLQSRLPNHY